MIDVSLILVIMIHLLICVTHLITFLSNLGNSKQRSEHQGNFADTNVYATEQNIYLIIMMSDTPSLSQRFITR